MTYTLTPSNTTQRNVVWSVSPTEIATIDNGVITPLTTGECTIRCKSAENDSVYAECNLTVTAAVTLVESITLNNSSVSLDVGGSVTLTATVLPANADNTSVTWSVDNENVSISPNGLECTVTASTDGFSIITVSANDGSGKTATCNVNIGNQLAAVYSLDELVVNNDTAKIVKTDITPFAEDKNNFTIYTECTASTMTNQSTVWHCMFESSGWPGACVSQLLAGDKPGLRYKAISGAYKVGSTDASFVEVDKKMKIAFVYNKELQKSTMYYVYEGETALNAEQLTMLVNSSVYSQPLIIGGYTDTSGKLGRPFTGTINTFKYYEQALTEDEVKNLMGLSN